MKATITFTTINTGHAQARLIYSDSTAIIIIELIQKITNSVTNETIDYLKQIAENVGIP